MATKKSDEVQPIIVKKIKKGGGGGHHGGAWKVAYADFVTAMMAFFLLLWLLNVTTDEARNAIANYFDPVHPTVSESTSGSGGVMGGLTMTVDGSMAQMPQPVTAPRSSGATREDTKTGDDDASETAEISSSEMDLEKLEEEFRQEENQKFEEAKKELEDAIKSNPELAELAKNLIVDVTPEGLRIQIVDRDGKPMFPSGSAEMFDYTRKLMAMVAQIILKMPNEISVRGHTDSFQYSAGAKYNNWDLSSDRANASRRVLIESQIPEKRFANVMGKADREHLVPEKPQDSQNRRISVIMLRETMEEALKRGALDSKLTPKKKEEIRQKLPDISKFKRTEGAVYFP